MKRWLAALAPVVSVVLLLTACGSGGGSPHNSGTGSSFLACEVTDTGGIDDRSFNASAWAGLKDAHSKTGMKVQYLQSTSQSDYTPNIQQFVQKKCGIIVTVGFLMGDATQTAAKQNPNQKFAIVDYSYSSPINNVRALLYQTDQDAFLGGYLAAGMSKTGKVGTFGGQDIPTVTIYMSGFVAGVRDYNKKHGTHVQVLGWTPETNTGSFTNDFTSQDKGAALTQTLMQGGADIIFPVAGSVGLGAASAVQQHNTANPSSPVEMEWVDVDGCVSAPQYCSLFITSVTKGIEPSVSEVAMAAQKGQFKGGNYEGTLANGGVSLAPYHDFASKIPSSLQSEITQLKQGIISGSVSVDPKSYPAS
jgi:basic membrane protein A